MIVYCLEIQSFFWGFFRPLLTFQFQSGRPFCTPIGLRNMYSNNGGDRSREGFGKMGYGCKHYRRRCLIRAPCCNEIFSCRHCHNESTATSDKHEIPRHDVRSVICLICDTEQKVVQLCSNCGVNMGEYFCDVCKFYDDNIEKSQYHCFDCGICRVGGKNNYFHCLKCGSCYSNILFEDHVCVENSMKCHCPICYEYLFDSLREVNVLKCGHTIHSECLTQMEKHKQHTCPICLKLIFDMTRVEKQTYQQFDAINISENQQSAIGKKPNKVWFLCNDCNDTMEAYFNILGNNTCCYCHSYNTRVIDPPVLPQ